MWMVAASIAVLMGMPLAARACEWCHDMHDRAPLAGTMPGQEQGGTFQGQLPDPALTRRYFVAAEPVDWSYAPSGRDAAFDVPVPAEHRGPAFHKYRYTQYSDAAFTTPVAQPAWQGLCGPTLHVVVGEYLSVTFINRTDQALSMHPHGLTYDKDSEGAFYFPDPGKGAWVSPGGRFTYIWRADASAGPAPGEPSSKAWLYHSHVRADREINLGLVGSIVVTDPARARLDATPSDIDREVPLVFQVFDENPDLAPGADLDDEPADLKQRREAFDRLTVRQQHEVLEAGTKHAINGRIFANLDGLVFARGARVRWYLSALGSENGMHTAHWHGHTVTVEGRRADVVELLPASMRLADMEATNPGTWLLQCHVADHMMAGMYCLYRVEGLAASGVVTSP